jgi:putative polyhydroxyalkanoate system protein
MPKYQVDIPHSVPPEDAKRLVAGATEKLQRDYGATCTWKGENILSVSRKGLDALVTLEPTRVHIDLNLGFLLTPFAERIKSGIAKELSSILSKTA